MKNICDESGLAKSEKGVRWTANAHTQNRQIYNMCARYYSLKRIYRLCLLNINYFFFFLVFYRRVAFSNFVIFCKILLCFAFYCAIYKNVQVVGCIAFLIICAKVIRKYEFNVGLSAR